MRKALKATLVSVTCWLIFASSALAARSDNGQGVLGELDDKTITYGGFIVIAFFTLFVTVMSIIQAKLEKRKERKSHGHSGDDRLGGW